MSSSSSFSVAPQIEKCEKKINVFGHNLLTKPEQALYRLNPIKPGSVPPTILPGKKIPILING